MQPNHAPIHVIIPMSGQGTRFAERGYKDPKPLISIHGKTIIERLVETFPKEWPITFVMAENHQETKLPAHLKNLRPDAKIDYVKPHKKGPGLAIEKGLTHIPPDAPVLVSYCDYGMRWDPTAFEALVRQTECDACVISYRGFHAHYTSPVKYAYCRMDGELVKEIREKHYFTDNRENEFASSGGYYFKSAKLLSQSLKDQESLGLILNGETYTSLTVEALIRSNDKAQVRVFDIPYFFQWGTPDDLEDYVYWEKTFNGYKKAKDLRRPQVKNVVIPMAGLGSRFQSLTDVRKPLLNVHGKAMILRALETLPQAEKTLLITLNKIVEPLNKLALPPQTEVLGLESTPPGQALTTEKAIGHIEPGAVFISACDHGAVINLEKWKLFLAQKFDAAIFTVRGFPGTRRKPLSYSYVQTDGEGDFPIFKKVGVKSPSTDNPQNEHLLVGTFWFSDEATLKLGIDDLKTNGAKVNNELYLDGIFNSLKTMNKKVGVFELDGYMNWGDPDSLMEVLYWEEVFLRDKKVSEGIRPRFPGGL